MTFYDTQNTILFNICINTKMHNNTNNQFELISKMLINHCQENNQFAYNIENDKMVGFGIIDKSNQFCTNLSETLGIPGDCAGIHQKL